MADDFVNGNIVTYFSGNWLLNQFSKQIDRVIDWSKQADADAYAALGREVLADVQDPLAVRLLTRCAAELDVMINALPPTCGTTAYLSGELAQACFSALSSGETA